MTDPTKSESIRASVAQTYTSVLERTLSPEADDIVKLVTYASDQVEGLPEEAVDASFGCGNPLAFAGVKPGDTVVDLGSGAGIDLLIAAERVGREGRVIGVDMTPAMIEAARAHVEAAGLTQVEVRQGLMESLPVDDVSVDWIISNCAINLSPDKPAVFAEIARVLKPGGQMQVSDIVMEPNALPVWIRECELLHDACIAGAIDEPGYLQGLEHAGLTDARVVERVAFDAVTIKALIQSGEAPEIATILGALGDTEQRIDELAHHMDGKIWSAKIYARKS